MKFRVFSLLIAVFFVFLAGCNSSSVTDIAPKKKAPGTGFHNVATNESNSKNVKDTLNENESDNATDKNNPGQTNRKIIKDGILDLETEDVNKAYANILSYAKENGGYEFSHQKTVREDYISIEAVIKIKPEKLDALMSYACSVSNVINSSTASDDITDQYYDAQIRLETKRKALERYYDILRNTQELNEILIIQTEINKLTEDIEASEGKLRLWDQLVSESSLRITISQVDDPLKPKIKVNWSALSWGDMGIIIKNGFTTVLNTVVTVLQWAVIVLISVSPLIIIAGVILIIIKLRSKRKLKKLNRINEIKESENITENK